jgi:hypothetical protein
MNQSKIISGSRWVPDSDLPTHAGQRQLPDADYFMPPPLEIGKLVSAGTTLDQSARLLSPKTLWLFIGGLGILVMLFICLAMDNFKGFSLDSIPIAGFSALGLMWGAWELTKTKISKNYCSYIGKKGLAEYELIGDRVSRPKESLFRFRDASYLYRSTTDWYGMGIYTSSNYSCTWRTNVGSAFQIAGEFRRKKNVPLPEHDRWYFANTADLVWTDYLLSTIDKQLTQNGHVEFVLLTQDDLVSLRVGHDFFEFVSKKDGSQRVMRSDIQRILLNSGNLKFEHKDPAWWSRKGTLSLEYDRVPNSRVFEMCLKEWLNIRLQVQ